MEVIVRKPTQEEIDLMKRQPTWSKEVSVFDWSYNSEENCLILEGEVTVEYEGKSVSFGEGDFVIFPEGLECVWKVTKPVLKHYIFK